jgi:YgiT-type zinc finger domain-containing protein
MSCEFCRIGHYESVVAPYIQWLDGHIMVIPNAPAYSCDICGHMEYDLRFVQQLDKLLTRLTNEETYDGAAFQQPIMANPAAMATTRRSQ